MILLALFVVPLLLYLPGTLICRAALGPGQPADLLERHYERVLAGVLLNGWLALLLAESGWFSIWLHLAIVALICAAAFMIARRRSPSSNSQTQDGSPESVRPLFTLHSLKSQISNLKSQ